MANEGAKDSAVGEPRSADTTNDVAVLSLSVILSIPI